MTTAIDNFAALNAGSARTVETKNEAGSAERFLKLLVSQMQNQDPLNPMDNAQITSQIAQINTVSGIDTLNQSVQGLNTQFAQMQMMQGASLVSRDVTLQGNRLSFDEGVAVGGFELAGTADRVQVEVLSGGGRVIDTVDLGTLQGGRHNFNWTPAAGLQANDAAGYTFRVVPTSGTQPVAFTPLMRDHVEAVSLVGDVLTLETSLSGSVPYSAVRSLI